MKKILHIKIVRKILKSLYRIPAWITVLLLGWIFYDRKYFHSQWFSTPFREGWLWAYRDIWHRIVYLKNLGVRWPCSPDINCGLNVVFDPEDLNDFNGSGNYYQTIDAGIVIGKGTWIAKNVGIITSNHDLQNPDNHQPGKDVILGEHCWIGMNSIILPGVVLGDHTVVGAGAVVTHSFPEGYCVIAGNPAKKIKDLTN